MAPLPYKEISIMKLNGLKNSTGGEEPERSSAIIGERKKSTKAGENDNCNRLIKPIRHHFHLIFDITHNIITYTQQLNWIAKKATYTKNFNYKNNSPKGTKIQ